MSWKQYGGMKKLDHFTNLNVISIATDDFTIRNAYQGLLTICGEVHVSQRSLENQSKIGGNITVDKNIMLQEKLLLGSSQTFIKGDASGVGINVLSPKALLDLSTNQTNVLRVYTSNQSSKNILSQNGLDYGLICNVDPTSIVFDFYHENNSIGNIQEASEASEASFRYKNNSFSLETKQVFIGTEYVDDDSTMLIRATGNTTYNCFDGINNIQYKPTLHIQDISLNPLFVIDHSSIGFSIGGGSHNGKSTGLYHINIVNQDLKSVAIFKGTCFRTNKTLI
jgi:hypothetical protein